jgi:hypothetical protein
MLEIARSYVDHVWRATHANVLHGVDADGVRVDTPDSGFVKDGWRADGSANTGVPYQWGGFSTLAEFDAGVRASRCAGHAPADESSDASYRAVGVDCSGLVSRAWNLPFKHSSASLPSLCYALDGWTELLPGDIANRANHHVMLFESYANAEKTQLRVIEAAVPAVHATVVEVAELARSGYVPLRYKPLDPRWLADVPALAAATLTLALDDKPVRWRATGKDTDAAGWSKRPDPLRTSHRGEWARYRGTYVHSLRSPQLPYMFTLGLASVDERRAKVSYVTTRGSATEERVAERPLGTDTCGALLQLFLELDLVDLEVSTTTAERGRATIGGKELSAVRRTISAEARLYRHDGTRVQLELVLVESAAVPLHGVLDARIALTVGESATPVKIEHHFALEACRKE